MTTSSGRSPESRRTTRGISQWLIGFLLLLAITASIFASINKDLSLFGSLAIICALWAAAIGAILVSQFRRQVDASEAKSRDLRLIYELQLEREIAARRQYELGVEADLRARLSHESNAQLQQLQHEVIGLRSALESLVGGELPESQLALLREERRELPTREPVPTGAAVDNFGLSNDGLVANQDFASTTPLTDRGQHAAVSVIPAVPLIPAAPIVSDKPATVVVSDRNDVSQQRSVRVEESPVEITAEVTPVPADILAETQVAVEETPIDKISIAEPPADTGDRVNPEIRRGDFNQFDQRFASPEFVPATEVFPIVTAAAPAEHRRVAPQFSTGRHGSALGNTAPRTTRGSADPSINSSVTTDGATEVTGAAHATGRSVAELLDQVQRTLGSSSTGGRRRKN